MSPISVWVCTHACLQAVFIWCVCVYVCELNTEHCYIVSFNQYSYAVLINVQLLIM